ncbi:MAG: Hachiman antiphage defense system protein HamA [Phenylobacterium sp.]|uniref:Hachiman antiphage defense system protein HamA n=1 Tax=Phenylobacterium sp. TaxID=1871053 RepID=UPI003BB57EA1
MSLFDQWCETTVQENGQKQYLTIVEKPDGRGTIIDQLAETVRAHYDDLQRIADDVDELGYDGAAGILRELLPTGVRARAGDLGEILASELTAERLEFAVPVRRMRFKDGREVPMRGDDFIGVNYAADDGGLWLLKGEAKSRRTLGKTTITQAREALRRDDGRCTPSSLLFVANRLLEGDDEQAVLGRLIRNEVGRKALDKSRIDHALFTMSGNGPIDALLVDYNSAEAGRGHAVINLHIDDYDDFISEVFDAAGDLGDS